MESFRLGYAPQLGSGLKPADCRTLLKEALSSYTFCGTYTVRTDNVGAYVSFSDQQDGELLVPLIESPPDGLHLVQMCNPPGMPLHKVAMAKWRKDGVVSKGK